MVRRVRDSDADLLRYLREVGIRPDVQLEIVGRSDASDALRVRIADREIALRPAVASAVFVERAAAEQHAHDPS